MSLPEPDCKHGYPREQLESILETPERFEEFMRWMYGQTMTLCDGRRYNHEARQYEPSGCTEPHGPVVYPWDLRRFLAGLGVAD